MTKAGQVAAVFLDRDGTINVDHGYVHRVEDLEFIPGAPAALKAMQGAGYQLIVVTNQSGVARGLYTEADVNAVHAHMQDVLTGHGVAPLTYYYCPHHPEHGDAQYRRDCEDRKPGIGMFRRACRDFTIDIERSFMVGDKRSDLEFARAAGLQPILVRTGEGRSLALDPIADADIWVTADLTEAAARILAASHRG